MIVIRVNATIKPDKRAEFLAAVKQETAPSKEFAGCAAYVWSESVLEPNQFSLYEEWETLDNFQTYKNSEHFQQIGKAVFPLLTEHPESSYYDAALFETA